MSEKVKSIDSVDIDGNQLLRCVLNKIISQKINNRGNRDDCINAVLRELASLQVANAITINSTFATASDIAKIFVGQHFSKEFFERN